MSFAWRKIGSFNTPAEAEYWYQQQGIAHTDARVDKRGEGVELSVRESALEGKDDDPRPYGY